MNLPTAFFVLKKFNYNVIKTNQVAPAYYELVKPNSERTEVRFSVSTFLQLEQQYRLKLIIWELQQFYSASEGLLVYFLHNFLPWEKRRDIGSLSITIYNSSDAYLSVARATCQRQ